jgi:acylaminoacyl-peptidase
LEALKKDFMKKLSYASLVLSGAVQIVEGIPKDISAGQVVWAPHLDMPPSDTGGKQLLVFVGWSSFAGNFSTPRKLGMKYCYNRPCSLYYVEAPVPGR